MKVFIDGDYVEGDQFGDALPSLPTVVGRLNELEMVVRGDRHV